jgi:hypothetical protein
MAYMIDTKSRCRRKLQSRKNEPLISAGVDISRTIQKHIFCFISLLNHASALNLKVEETGAIISDKQPVNAYA